LKIKSCGKLLLTEENRKNYLPKFLSKKSSSIARNAWFKKVIVECKKQKRCLDAKCNEENGIVKKQPKEATKILFVKTM